jgi:DNA-directed RNA polymerase specialized sigma24 family protein
LFGGRSVSSEYAHRAAEEQQIALRILKTAPHCDREALARFYLNEQSPEEICRDLRLTLEEFGLIKSRAKARFRELCAARVARKPAKSETRVSHPGQALGAQLSK